MGSPDAFEQRYKIPLPIVPTDLVVSRSRELLGSFGRFSARYLPRILQENSEIEPAVRSGALHFRPYSDEYRGAAVFTYICLSDSYQKEGIAVPIIEPKHKQGAVEFSLGINRSDPIQADVEFFAYVAGANQDLCTAVHILMDEIGKSAASRDARNRVELIIMEGVVNPYQLLLEAANPQNYQT